MDVGNEVSVAENALLVWRFEHEWKTMQSTEAMPHGDPPLKESAETNAAPENGTKNVQTDVGVVSELSGSGQEPNSPISKGGAEAHKADDSRAFRDMFRMPKLTSPKPYGP